MSRIKRIALSLMVCMLMLAQGALAEKPSLTISQVREEVAAGWHETFESHGRTIEFL